MQLIPAIDLLNGRCVRLHQGDFDQAKIYEDDPLEIAQDFRSAGLTHLHVVDLDGARNGIQSNAAVVQALAADSDMAIQLGGGIRDSRTIRRWLANGVSRCVIGSLAIEEPATVKSWLREFGAERIVLALDVRVAANGTPQVATHGWVRNSECSLWDCLETFVPAGLCRVLCTDISRDGALSGPNTELYRAFRVRFPALELQASGGVRSAEDLHELRQIGVHSAIAGRAMLDGRISELELRTFLRVA
jgi:phosphoribosylformimino-5-aminoimidazole carboxamide ribotide isomerase